MAPAERVDPCLSKVPFDILIFLSLLLPPAVPEGLRNERDPSVKERDVKAPEPLLLPPKTGVRPFRRSIALLSTPGSFDERAAVRSEATIGRLLVIVICSTKLSLRSSRPSLLALSHLIFNFVTSFIGPRAKFGLHRSQSVGIICGVLFVPLQPRLGKLCALLSLLLLDLFRLGRQVSNKGFGRVSKKQATCVQYIPW